MMKKNRTSEIIIMKDICSSSFLQLKFVNYNIQ